MINDSEIAWNKKRVFRPAVSMLGMYENSGVLTSLGAGSAVLQEAQSDSELAGVAINAAGNEVYDFWPIPWDCEIREPMRFRIWFSHSTTTADTPDWIMSVKGIGKQVALSDAASSADETLTFAAASVSTTANAIEILDWELSTSDLTIVSTDKALLIAVECNGLGSAGANEITLLGYEIEYVVGATQDSKQRDFTRNAAVAA